MNMIQFVKARQRFNLSSEVTIETTSKPIRARGGRAQRVEAIDIMKFGTSSKHQGGYGGHMNVHVKMKNLSKEDEALIKKSLSDLMRSRRADRRMTMTSTAPARTIARDATVTAETMRPSG